MLSRKLPKEAEGEGEDMGGCGEHSAGGGQHLPADDVYRVRHQRLQAQGQLVYP